MIIETCPKCGSPVQTYIIPTYPPFHKKICLSCGWSWEQQEKIVFRPVDEKNFCESYN